MADGTINDPIQIDTSFRRSAGLHFWNIVNHPLTTPLLYPDLKAFLEEIAPILEDLDSGTYFTFTSDPNHRTYQLVYDRQTEVYFIVTTTLPYVRTPLPQKRPTAASWVADKLGITDAKKRWNQFIDSNNPFSLLKKFEDGDKQ